MNCVPQPWMGKKLYFLNFLQLNVCFKHLSGHILQILFSVFTLSHHPHFVLEPSAHIGTTKMTIIRITSSSLLLIFHTEDMKSFFAVLSGSCCLDAPHSHFWSLSRATSKPTSHPYSLLMHTPHPPQDISFDLIVSCYPHVFLSKVSVLYPGPIFLTSSVKCLHFLKSL